MSKKTQRRSTELKRVEKATVEFKKHGCRGVLVDEGYVLTVAHCIQWTATGIMALGDGPEKITVFHTVRGLMLMGDVLALEPVADIAILGALDYSFSQKDADAYERWCEKTEPVP